MAEKPIIRHCMNCKYRHGTYHKDRWDSFVKRNTLYCDVKYIDITKPRIRALTCRHYEPKNSKEAQDND